MAFKKLFDQFKKNLFSEELTLQDAKVLAMLTVIYSDEKSDLKREMGLLKALCAFDHRLVNIDFPAYIERFKQFGGNLDGLFEKLAESIHNRDEKMDLLASAYLLASIDGYISKSEKQILHRLGNTLRMSLEDINTVEEHSEFITKTLNSSHRIERIKYGSSLQDISPGEAKIMAILAVIYSDEKQEVDRELSLLEALFSFDREGNDVDLEIIQQRFQKYHNNLDPLFEVFSDLPLEHEARINLFSSACLLAGIDGITSPEESAMLERLAAVFHLEKEDVQKAQQLSQALVSTMRELRVLS